MCPRLPVLMSTQIFHLEMLLIESANLTLTLTTTDTNTIMSNWIQFPQAQVNIANAWEWQLKLADDIVDFIAEMHRKRCQVGMDHLGRIILQEFPHPDSELAPTMPEFLVLSPRKCLRRVGSVSCWMIQKRHQVYQNYSVLSHQGKKGRRTSVTHLFSRMEWLGPRSISLHTICSILRLVSERGCLGARTTTRRIPSKRMGLGTST